jgi:hypothetical protein
MKHPALAAWRGSVMALSKSVDADTDVHPGASHARLVCAS